MKDHYLEQEKMTGMSPADFDSDDVDVETIDIASALEEFDAEDSSPDIEEDADIEKDADIKENTAIPNPAPADKPAGQKRSSFPYIVIAVLAVSLAALGVLTFMSLNRLTTLQGRVAQLRQTVKDISDSASVLGEKAAELSRLQDEEIAAAKNSPSVKSGEVQGPAIPDITEEEPQEEGMLSPSSGSSTFTNHTDESMDALLIQIEPLLPQNNGSWSVYVCNLMKGSEGTIGGGRMQAASLIKLFIMGTVYENYDSLAQLHGKETLDANLRSMITVSDNDAANTLVNWLGSGDNANGMTMVNQFCKNHGYTDTSMGRMLLQSNENGDNYTSVQDCGRFMKEVYEINKGTASNASLSHADSMYYLLKLQERTNKIPAQLPEGVHTANKTGELSNVENDAGIIFDTAKGIDLVVCFMSENLTDTAAAQSSIAQNTRLIYGYYNE